MVFDLEHFSGNPDFAYDICIIGAGPAGITLARELSSTNLHICVLESGGYKRESFTDDLRKIITSDLDVKSYSQERVVGGTSSTWGGLSAPLDPIDMEERPFVPVPGWPITYADLIPYWERAADGYAFPSLEEFKRFKKLRDPHTFNTAWKDLEEKIFLATEEPVHFGKKFIDTFQKDHLDLFLHATVVRLNTRYVNDKEHVDSVTVLSKERSYVFRAKVIVLASGCMENTRLLLVSDDTCARGIGNQHDQVGRYFMNHPKGDYGEIALHTPVEDLSYFFGCIYEGFAGYTGIRIREKRQRELQLLNASIRFEPLFPWSGNPGVASLVFLVKKMKFIVSFWRRFFTHGIVALRDYSETGDDSDLQNAQKDLRGWIDIFCNIALNISSVIQYLFFRISSKRVLISRIRIRHFMEMEPYAENRITLGEESDSYGQRVPLLSYNVTSLDKKSLITLYALLAQEVEILNLGSVQGNLCEEKEWPVTGDASHYLGTTRMGNDPHVSVVDVHLRVHSTDNLYVVGGSVFSTSGCANPTFTICALAIRLADLLKQEVNS